MNHSSADCIYKRESKDSQSRPSQPPSFRENIFKRSSLEKSFLFPLISFKSAIQRCFELFQASQKLSEKRTSIYNEHRKLLQWKRYKIVKSGTKLESVLKLNARLQFVWISEKMLRRKLLSTAFPREASSSLWISTTISDSSTKFPPPRFLADDDYKNLWIFSFLEESFARNKTYCIDFYIYSS